MCQNGHTLSFLYCPHDVLTVVILDCFVKECLLGLHATDHVDDFKAHFSLADDFVIVANSGLMSRKNVALLSQGDYKYIIGARIRNTTGQVRDWILSRQMDDGEACERRLPDGDRLIFGYSSSRAAKDAYNRKRSVELLRKAYSSGRLTKENVNRRGYNKFLEISKDVYVTIVEDRIWKTVAGTG